jgi:hypothetical protein
MEIGKVQFVRVDQIKLNIEYSCYHLYNFGFRREITVNLAMYRTKKLC